MLGATNEQQTHANKHLYYNAYVMGGIKSAEDETSVPSEREREKRKNFSGFWCDFAANYTSICYLFARHIALRLIALQLLPFVSLGRGSRNDVREFCIGFKCVHATFSVNMIGV